MNLRHCDLAIVGAGIIGLAHALAAARQGRQVTVFERDRCSNGASIRNFGLGLCLGQPPGELLELAQRSREVWLEVLAATGCWHKAEGSLIVARTAREWSLLQEFQARYGEVYQSRLLTAAEVARIGAAGVGGLYGPHEIALESRRAVPQLARWLAEHWGVRFEYQTQVLGADLPRLQTSRGEWRAEQLMVCSGHDFQTLFADAFSALDLQCCSLQMLRLANPGRLLGPALLTGLSCLHYPSFAGLRGVAAVRAEVAEREPALLAHGIHLIVQQVGETGELIVGDSHHYATTPAPFCSAAVDDHLLQLAQTLLGQDLTVLERWQGVYASGPKPYERLQMAEGVSALAMTSGIGMSIGFALAEATLRSGE
ncbi:TIGR03364 family FAD-dependent oxidoreductase [Parachitinimonas caeni]|uniref:TIGR03364 family FAD-dependent oxidoreductase n=1 Tax=Parachitinimonas caeni TaxID=3031301 RepID=A0ABT7DZV9_9NEIS|nr:TIGR03364 family FAD-dependent oxidoreductase [Parachitinimonas caeni]MDK2125599.1 TIGR03364 family FAD-dependent oxidoreductase [Parachitinimonas caeni]